MADGELLRLALHRGPERVSRGGPPQDVEAHAHRGALTLSPVWRLRALVVALSAPPLLEIFSLSRLIPFLSRGTPVPDALDDQALATWVDTILNALPWPWRRTCLRRAVVLYALLRHAGRPVQLWIGVRKNRDAPDNEGVSAHAWLTSGEVPYLEANVDHVTAHTPIARFPEPLTN